MNENTRTGLIVIAATAVLFLLLGLGLRSIAPEPTAEPSTCQDFAVPTREAMKVKCSADHTIEAAEGLIICRCRE